MQLTLQSDQVIQSLTPLSALFPGRYFRVPDYQRGYAWEDAQVKALLDDLQVLAESKNSSLHYTGTLVLVPSQDHTSDYPVFDIVDGQQRLTTLSMLLNVLIRIVETESSVANGESELYQSFIGRGSALKGYRYVLQLNRDIEPFFRSLMKGESEKETIEYLSEKRLAEAYNQVIEWSRQYAGSADKARQWMEIVIGRLGLIAYQPQDANEAGMMFEVINNRGKRLTELEKVKNYLIYYSIKKQFGGLQDTINREWGRILKNLALAHHMADIDNQQLLRSVVIVYFGFRKRESNAAYKKLKNEFSLASCGDDQARKLSDFVEFLSDCSRYYEALFNHMSQFRHHSLSGMHSVAEVIDLIRVQTAHSGVLPLYLCAMWLFEKNYIAEKDLLEMLRTIERVNFRVYMLPIGGARSDSGHGEMFRIAHKLYEDVVSAINGDDIRGAVKKCEGLLLSFVQQYGHKNLDDFKVSFQLDPRDQNMDYAKWRGLRYFLANYEQELDSTRTSSIDLKLKANKANRHNDFFQIEHIYAKECPFHGPDLQQTSHQKRRLGNLMLLEWGVNGSFSNKPIEEKLKYLHENESSAKRAMLAQTTEVIKDYKHVFHKSQSGAVGEFHAEERFQKYVQLLDRIENRLMDFAVKRWAFASELSESTDAGNLGNA